MIVYKSFYNHPIQFLHKFAVARLQWTLSSVLLCIGVECQSASFIQIITVTNAFDNMEQEVARLKLALDLHEYHVPELQHRLRQMGLSESGVKRDLIDRIVDHTDFSSVMPKHSSEESTHTLMSDNVESKPHAPNARLEKLKSLEVELQILKVEQSIMKLKQDQEDTSLKQDMKQLIVTANKNQTISSLPRPEPPKFDGNPLEYPQWRAAFTTLIDERDFPEQDKIYYLQQYLSGPPLKAIQSMSLSHDSQAYVRALEIIDERYGNKFTISHAFKTRLSSWPKVRSHDATGLRDFSDFLNSCALTKRNISGLAVLDDDMKIQELARILPDWAMSRWSDFADEFKVRHSEYPMFDEFVNFTGRMARKANDPVTSMQALKGVKSSTSEVKVSEKSPHNPSYTRKSTSANKATVHKTNTEPANNNSAEKSSSGKYKCVKCETDTHCTAECRELIKLKYHDRQKFVRNSSLCFGCILPGHVSKECPNRSVCKTCGRQHATIFHKEPKDECSANSKGDSVPPAQESVVHKTSLSPSTLVSTMILPVYVTGVTGHEIMTYALIDTQSDSTFVSDKLAESLGSGIRCNLSVSTMTTHNQVIKSTKYQQIKVRGFNSDRSLVIPAAFSRPSIPVNRSHIPTPDLARGWAHLESIADKIAPLQSCEVGLLIGYNCSDASAPRNVLRGNRGEPYGVETDLGWSVVGGALDSVGDDTGSALVETHRIKCKEVQQLDSETILRHLEEEFKDVDSVAKPKSQNDMLFEEIMTKNVELVDGHYTMPLPFRSRPVLPNNREPILKRFCSLMSKFKHNTEFRDKYVAFMDDIIQNGEAELVPEDSTPAGSVWYIPHHGVESPKKPGKVRVVFDCSASFKGQSLNKCVLQGPDYNNNLSGVLCRFRREPVAVMCDVKKMYHQFRVSPDDRDYLRFIWLKDGKPQDYRMAVHVFGASSSPSVACFGLKQLARDNQQKYPNASHFIENHFYVDDGLISVSTVSEAIKLMSDTREMCSSASLTLHKFLSNHNDVTQALVPETDHASATGEQILIGSEGKSDKALGVMWNTRQDTLSISAESKPISTRRDALSLVSSVYDPLGLVTPFVFRAKSLLQVMCKERLSWDDPIPEHLLPVWHSWCQELRELAQIQIPRCIKPKQVSDQFTVELHVFSDASTIGYGACAYLRFVDHLDKVACSKLIMSKSRVAPLKTLTIPRLELQAAVVGSKLAMFLQQELQYDDIKTIFWSDSTAVLGYIRNEDRQFHVFVCNRVRHIRNVSDPQDWHYVQTNVNPADLLSRGCSVQTLKDSCWYDGPEFLNSYELTFSDKQENFQLDPDDPEVKRIQCLKTTATPNTGTLLDRLGKLSTLTAILNALIVLESKARRLRSQPLPTKSQMKAWALGFLIRLIQETQFEDEISTLQAGFPIHASSKLRQLDPYLDENGILRVGGRLEYSRYTLQLKHPMIVPHHPLTRIICEHYHRMCSHQGRMTTINILRANGIHIVKGTTLVSSVIYNCVTCRKLRGPLLSQKMSPLPHVRSEELPPFTHVGYDCFGPMTVKDGRKAVKRYGVVFTCMSSRAVHIELCDDLSTDCFINTLRNFIALRGPIATLRSDRGTNFVGADNELTKALLEMNEDAIRQFTESKQCQFFFNTPSSSHMGGVWERMIRTIRQVLAGMMASHSCRLDTSSLRTLLYEVMAMINSRPLTTIQTTKHSEPEPLTPNHLLTMKVAQSLPPPGAFEEADVYSRKRWRRVQSLAQTFWSRWRHEFLSTLQSRSKWHTSQRNLVVDDIVLLSDDSPGISRMDWRMARVIKVHPSKDGLVRSVTLKLGTQTLDRPVHKCVLLTN